MRSFTEYVFLQRSGGGFARKRSCEETVSCVPCNFLATAICVLSMSLPPSPGPGEVQVRVRAVGLNHIDVWGFRGMAFAKRKLPLTVGAEAAGEIVAIGESVDNVVVGDRVALYGAKTCGECRACREGRDNLCENVAGIMGFHVDGFTCELVNMQARLVVKIPDGVSFEEAACAPIAFGTVQHMLFDNAKLEPGETVLVHAGDRASARQRSGWRRLLAARSSPP